MLKGKYKLIVPHYGEGDRYLEAGTEIGGGTQIEWPGDPSMGMEPLDDTARHEYAEWERLRGPKKPVDGLPAKGFPAPGPGQVVAHEAPPPVAKPVHPPGAPVIGPQMGQRTITDPKEPPKPDEPFRPQPTPAKKS